jgi:Alcohol dehydrogenase GroES-like domain
MTIDARRVVFSAIKKVEWETLSLPDELGPTQVLVKAVRTLVSAGTEIAIYSGAHIGYSIPGSRYPRLPYHAGYAFAGTVEAVGAEVTGFAPGDRAVASWRVAARACCTPASNAPAPAGRPTAPRRWSVPARSCVVIPRPPVPTPGIASPAHFRDDSVHPANTSRGRVAPNADILWAAKTQFQISDGCHSLAAAPFVNPVHNGRHSRSPFVHSQLGLHKWTPQRRRLWEG